MPDKKKDAKPASDDKKKDNVDPDDAESQEDADENGSDDEGEDEEELSLDKLDAKTRALFNAEAAKIRKSAEEKTKRKLEAEAAKKTAEAEGDFKKLYEAEVAAHAETQSKVKLASLKSRAIEACLKAGVPDPEVNYKRLIATDDDEELLADAKLLKKSFGATGHRDPKDPPATPAPKDGGKNDVGDKKKAKASDVDDELVANEMRLPIYSARM